MNRQNAMAFPRREDAHQTETFTKIDAAHPVDRHVGQQIRIQRMQSKSLKAISLRA